MAPSASHDVTDVLDGLGLRVEGQVLNAAVVLFGRRALPHSAQCELRMARFRGTDKTEFLANVPIHMKPPPGCWHGWTRPSARFGFFQG